MRELAVIIPMYNEEANAERCILTVCKVLSDKLPGSKLIVVNDGSRDKTQPILKHLASQKIPFIYVSHSINQGYGSGLVTGIKTALKEGFTYGLFMDSDLTNDPNTIPRFAEMLKRGDFDLVKASRYVQGGGMSGVPLSRRIVSIVGNFIASRLFHIGLSDCTNGFHAVRLALLADRKFTERGFPFLLEELYFLKQRGARVTEFPYILTARIGTSGPSKFRYSFKTFWGYLKYALRASLIRRQVETIHIPDTIAEDQKLANL